MASLQRIDRMKQLKDNYGSYVIMPQQSSIDILENLKKTVDCIPQEEDFKGSVFYKMFKKNVIAYLESNMLSFDFPISTKQYIIKRNKKSRIYYKIMEEMGDDSDIYFIIELHSGFFECSSNRLFQEMYIKGGINEQNYLAEDDTCLSYLTVLERYLKAE